MTSKPKKTKRKRAHARPAKIARLRASAEEPSFRAGEEEAADGAARWNRPRKQKISLHVDMEVVDWFKAMGPGYQTKINRILRRVMTEGKKKAKR